jgi:signal transduction histidine kinase
LAEVLEIVVAFSQESLRSKPVTLLTNIPEDLPEIYGDIDRVEQIVTNIVGNAIKFTPEGSITISAWQEEDMVCVCVRDTGIGIPAEAQTRIFHPFEQVDGSTTREFGGTGLGLAITKELVELHGGRIRVESELGAGSAFFITLPRADDTIREETGEQPVVRPALPIAEPPSPPVPQPVRLDTQPAGADVVSTYDSFYDVNHDKDDQFTSIPHGKGERILVVDDEPINIEVYKTQLTQYHYEVLAASNGVEALDIIEREQPDLVILDLMMPKMSGFRVCQILRQEKHLHNLPVIMLTARSNIYDKVYGLNVGANDYVIKPFHQDELLTRISRLLNMAELQHELLRNNERLRSEMRQRKQAEAELAALNEELEQRVQQRTAQLEAVNTELKDFAYVVSHDLKAPLRGITRISNWLLSDYAEAFDAQGQEMLDLLESRVRRMDRLIDGVLQYSRVGRIVETREDLDLNILVADVIDSLAPPPQIQIVVETPLPILKAEPTRMTQLFQNLLSNAIKFMDKPEGHIRIAATDAGDQWTFTVADDGPGIAPRHHTRIFQIFQTVTPSDEQEVNGVGLCIVKKIVESYGGTIWVESEVGEGSTFFFTLPKT